MSKFYVIILMLALTLCGAFSTQAAVFFDTDFETCAVGTQNDFPCEGWDDRGKEFNAAPRHNGIAITNVGAFSGSKMVNTIFVDNGSIAGPTNCGIDNPSIYKSQTPGTHMFARFAFKRGLPWTASVNGTTKLVRWRSNAGNGGEYPVVSVWMNNLNYILAVEGGWGMGTVNYTGGGPVSTTSFDQVEVEFQFNTPGQSDGFVRLWVNNVLKIERLNLQLIGPTPTSINGQGLFNPSTGRFIETQIFVQCGIGNMYWDRFAVGDTRIGTAGTIPNPDITPPTAPTNLAASAATSTLTWTAGTDTGGSGYAGVQVFRCVRNPGDCAATTQLTTVAAPVTSYVDITAQSGFTYDYAIRSFDGVGLVSAFTSEVSLTPPTTNRRVLFTDLFTRADNASIGASYNNGTYTTPATFLFKIASNRLAPTTATQNNHIAYYNVAVPNDQFGSIRVSDGVSATDNFYVMTRLSSTTTWNGYECALLNATTGRLARRDAGAGTVLSQNTLSTPVVVGDRLRGESQGTTHRCYVVHTNAQGQQTEELVASGTDATYASGQVGIRVAADVLPSIRIDEFLVGDFTSTVNSSISHDSTTVSALTNTASPLTWTHTVANTSNRLLTVCLQTRNSTTPVTVTGVTANGVSLTSVRSDSFTGANSLHTSLWRLTAPSPGVNTIVATFSAAPGNWGVGASSSFYGVEQVAPVDAVGGANGTGTAVSLPVTSTVTGTLAVDCVAGLDSFTAVGASQTIRSNSLANPGADGVGVSTKPLASSGATTTSWTQSVSTGWAGSVMVMKPAQVNNLQRPMILTGTAVPTGITGLTYGATTPTALRVTYGPNSGIGVQSVDIPIASVPGGVLSRTWSQGDEFVVVNALDAFGIPNGTNLEYLATTLVGIAPSSNTNPVVMTNPQPSTVLPAGTTSATISINIDQVVLSRECRAHTADVGYDSMPTTYQMNVQGNLASVAFPVSNGNAYTLYRTCVIKDDNGSIIAESPARSVSTFSVASSTGDVTPPNNVTNVVCLANGTQADCTHASATDAVSYEAYISSDAGVTYALAASYTSPTTSFTLMGLAPGQSYSVRVKALDVVGNFSAAFSNVSTFVMPSLTDVIPPGNVPFLDVVGFAGSVYAFFQVGVDAVSTTIEYCAGVTCTPGEGAITVTASPAFIQGLLPNTVYRFSAFHTDGAGNQSVAKSRVLELTTPSRGLGQARPTVPFGVVRPMRSSLTSIARDVRDPCGEQ